MKTTVFDVRYQAPEEWQANPGNIYVGRRLEYKTGKHAGQIWRPTIYTTPIKLPESPSRADRIQFIGDYLDWLADDRQLSVRRAIADLDGKRLGCWCGNYSGDKKPCYVLCHAVVLAILSNHWRPGVVVKELIAEWMALDLTRKTQ